MGSENNGTWPIGKRYDGGQWTVSKKEFQEYAEATNDENGAYFADEAVAPPMYHVRPLIGLMMMCATDPELEIDLLRLVHGEHRMAFQRPLGDGEKLELSGVLDGVDEKASGNIFHFSLYGDVDGQRVYEGNTSYFVRAPKGAQGSPSKPKPKAAPPTPPPPDWTNAQPVSKDQALRYAKVSGDSNPIHTNEDIAKAAGLPGCILHGLCTMAFAQRDIVSRYGKGDPARLATLGVRFARPVFPGETLTLKVWELGDGKLQFVTENSSGKAVIVNGTATIR